MIVVPTPFKNNHEPDISHVKSAIDSILYQLKKDDLIIIESTCPVGTTDKMKEYIFENRQELVDNINIAYCPERVLPGNILSELIENDRVVGGINDQSTKKHLNFTRNS